jgi:hypothetical protein
MLTHREKILKIILRSSWEWRKFFRVYWWINFIKELSIAHLIWLTFKLNKKSKNVVVIYKSFI